jgi:hypothetical protein
MIRPLPESKRPVKEMPAKVANMSAIRMPARTIRSGKEHAWLVLADIIMYLGIRHISILSNSKVPVTRCNSKQRPAKKLA